MVMLIHYYKQIMTKEQKIELYGAIALAIHETIDNGKPSIEYLLKKGHMKLPKWHRLTFCISDENEQYFIRSIRNELKLYFGNSQNGVIALLHEFTFLQATYHHII